MNSPIVWGNVTQYNYSGGEHKNVLQTLAWPGDHSPAGERDTLLGVLCTVLSTPAFLARLEGS